MKSSQVIVFTGLISLLLAGLLTPMTYATADSTSSPQADGQFPVFPTVIEEDAGLNVSPSPQTVIEEENVIKQTKTTKADSTSSPQAEPVRGENIAANETEVFSPWGIVKRAIFGRARAGEEGVVFALTALDAKPSGRGDLRYQFFYANNTEETLRNVSVQVFLPKDLQYLDSDLRPDSKGNEAVVFELGKVAAGEEGAIQMETRLKKKKAKEVIVQATMVYEDIDGGAHSVTAATNNAFNGKNGGLTASVFDGTGGAALQLFVVILLIALAFVVYQLVVLRASSQPRT